MRVIAVGHPEFDRKFLVVKSNDELKVRAVFENPKIRQLVAGQPSVYVRGEYGELRFEEPGSIEDIDRLKSMFNLFKEMLPQLHRLNSA